MSNQELLDASMEGDFETVKRILDEGIYVNCKDVFISKYSWNTIFLLNEI